MTINLSGITLRLVKNVDFFLITYKQLGAGLRRFAKLSLYPRTIIALTRVFPPSAKEPAVAARIGDVIDANQTVRREREARMVRKGRETNRKI